MNELNDIFKFDLIKIDKESDLKLFLKDISNYLIISQEMIFEESNMLVLKDLPIKINKLVEKINLSILKNNFNFRSNIIIGKYLLDDNSRKIIYNNIEVNLTEQEVKVLLYLKKIKKPVKVKELQKYIWGYNLDLETHTVETHIYRLRQKFNKFFKDNDLIQSLKNGYFIK